ncbi:guanine nucleotide binding protein, alpha subunit [Cyathus striatus]|nr:guanine nucleotide binding protein, alpha subunit [Cyathus striatus]
MPVSRKAIAWPPYPPPGETAEERTIRLDAELHAKRVSESIDRELDNEREAKKKELPSVKVLLLGQAESGKSTVLKNFQLHFAPKAFAAEAELWRPVIHLNLVRSVNFILNLLTTRFTTPQESNPMRRPSSSNGHGLTEDVRRLSIRLRPLREVEDSLNKVFSGAACLLQADISQRHQYNPAKASEVTILSGTRWRKMVKFSRQSTDVRPSIESADDIQNRRILAACRQEIISLWNNSFVQNALKSAEVELQEQAGFFLNDVERIAKEEYIPTSEDILRARVTTLGPEEHNIYAETSNEHTKLWTIYDVGGSRSQRAAWAQFFDDVNTIIFLAPMSAFNQNLAEDKYTNRLVDSLRLWEIICSNKILANVEFILFLNKLDILEAKLKSGVRFSKYVTSYTNQPNEPKPVAKYLLDVFVAKHQECSPKKRKLHPHLTCATDTHATSNVIRRIQETIIVKLLSKTNII